jgi:BNR repeat-containing family member
VSGSTQLARLLTKETRLRFRISKVGAAAAPFKFDWDASTFSSTQPSLPGIPSNDLMKVVTYPTFVNINDDLLLTYRIGEAGLGSDIIYRYSSDTHVYTYVGQHLTGVSNSPYINGMDYRSSRLHISWCYRNFIVFDRPAGPRIHSQQAGPNGPENNCDLNYAISDDLGETWRSSDGRVLARIGSNEHANSEKTIKPGAIGARIFEIPAGSGVLNQEAQTVDWEGRFWAINRENRSGEEKWVLYHRDREGTRLAFHLKFSG